MSAHHVKDAIITITKMFCVYLYQVNMCKALFCRLSKTDNLKSVENPKYFADIIFKYFLSKKAMFKLPRQYNKI